MTALERAGYLAHARTAGFQRRVDEARQIGEEWLSHCSSPMIAFSGGKDSTVMLDIIRGLSPPCPALFSNDEFNLPETLRYLDTIPNLHRIAATIMHTDWFYSWENGPEGLPPDTEWVEALKNDGCGTWCAARGVDGNAVGLREDENNYRRVHIRSLGTCFYVKKKSVWQCYPLAKWKTKDVWAYILSRGLPYNAAYDRLGELGIPPDQQRIGPFANRRALPYGQLSVLRMGWPEQFAAFANRFPEAWNYV